MKAPILLHSIIITVLMVCIGSIHTKAQQALNLDFEKLSIEGLARPWGWDVSTDADTKVSLDSLVKYHGQYSLKMEASSDTGPQVMSFSLEPFELKNKTVRIDGWIKTKELKGAANFVLTYTIDKDSTVTRIKSSDIINSTDWVHWSINAKLPATATAVNLEMHHAGTGIAWFDNLSLTVNGTVKQELEVTLSFSNKQIKWLCNNSHSLKTVDASAANTKPEDADLAAFKASVANARIIALGESTHGTSEFFRLKHRILEYCVYNLGVRIFAMEDHPLIVARVNKYVMGGAGSARSSMYGMLGVWQTKEVMGLIEWVRQYNDLHPSDKVEFTGFDIQNHSLAIDSLYSFIAIQAPGLQTQVKELLDSLKLNGINSYVVTDSVKLAWFTNASKMLDIITAQSTMWLSSAKSRQDSVVIYKGIQYATLVKQFAENTYRGHASLYRDIAMAENVSWIIDVYKPGAKVMLWAHDVHISRGDHSNNDWNIYNSRSMGSHLSRKYGAYYRSFGLFTYQGEYSCYVSYSNFNVTDCPLYVSPKGTLDEALHTVALNKKISALFLDLSSARSQGWFTQPVPVRFANHVNIEYGYWSRYSIPYQFDGIFFIDKTTSAKSYARN